MQGHTHTLDMASKVTLQGSVIAGYRSGKNICMYTSQGLDVAERHRSGEPEIKIKCWMSVHYSDMNQGL